jgi:hypothetical protein
MLNRHASITQQCVLPANWPSNPANDMGHIPPYVSAVHANHCNDERNVHLGPDTGTGSSSSRER